jgi:hypothetical protein
VDDVLMFTTRSRTLPFTGRINGQASQSQLAEVAWFVRGRTLYRRVLLIAPQTNLSGVGSAGFYYNYDLSARYVPPQGQGQQGQMVANTLADLTRPENRFAHTNGFTTSSGGPYYFYPPHPHNVGVWLGQLSSSHMSPQNTTPWLTGLKLPTLCESTCSSWDLMNALPSPSLGSFLNFFDAWRNPYVFSGLDPVTGNLTAYQAQNATRLSEDVILTNVIGFDVKAWDSGAPIIQASNGTVLLPGDPGYSSSLTGGSCTIVGYGAYVDLNYLYWYRAANQPKIPVAGQASSIQVSSNFSGAGNLNSGLQGSDPNGSTAPLCSVYDTWCTRFENYSNLAFDKSHDGFDDGSPNIGVVDGGNKKVIWPPYPAPLPGIQVKIRVYEPDSRQVREVTVTQSFLNE